MPYCLSDANNAAQYRLSDEKNKGQEVQYYLGLKKNLGFGLEADIQIMLYKRDLSGEAPSLGIWEKKGQSLKCEVNLERKV